MLDRPKGSAVLLGGVADLMNPQVRRRTIGFVAVQGMQPTLHRWTVADLGCRLDDLFNFVHDPATLLVQSSRDSSDRSYVRIPPSDGEVLR